MSCLAYRTMWFGVQMYFPGHLMWFVSFKPSRAPHCTWNNQACRVDLCWSFQCHLLPFVPFSLCLVPLVFVGQGLSCLLAFAYTVPSAQNALPLFYLQPRGAACAPQSKVSSPGLGLHHSHLLTSFRTCVLIHWFICFCIMTFPCPLSHAF